MIEQKQFGFIKIHTPFEIKGLRFIMDIQDTDESKKKYLYFKFLTCTSIYKKTVRYFITQQFLGIDIMSKLIV